MYLFIFRSQCYYSKNVYSTPWINKSNLPSLIAPDVTAAMLVQRTKVKKTFENLTFCFCFGTYIAVLPLKCIQRIVKQYKTSDFVDSSSFPLYGENKILQRVESFQRNNKLKVAADYVAFQSLISKGKSTNLTISLDRKI